MLAPTSGGREHAENPVELLGLRLAHVGVNEETAEVADRTTGALPDAPTPGARA